MSIFKMLLETPFGFVAEIDSDLPFEQDDLYEVTIREEQDESEIITIINGKKNVVSFFGLKPNTGYNITYSMQNETYAFKYTTTKPEYVLSVKDYGAIGDATHNDTSAINAAIYSAPIGSVVKIPKGMYLVDSIFLKSGVDIFLAEGAELIQNSKREELPVIKGYIKSFDHEGSAIANATWEGNPLDCYVSLIYGKNIENVRIYGDGTLNGNGEQGSWWIDPKTKIKAWRPRNMFLAHCKDITISGITSRNSAAWNLHPFYSEDLRFYALKIESASDSPNTDGLNPESCNDVEIVGCEFSVGDDCIAIKAGKRFMSRFHLRPSENITVRNCLMQKGHGGIVIGSEMSCGVKNVNVSKCIMLDTDRGLRIKTRRGRGDTAVVDDVSFMDVKMHKVTNCFTVNMFYYCDPDGRSDYVSSKKCLPKDNETPTVRNIKISNVQATDIKGSAIFIAGLPESPVTGVNVENSTFEFSKDRPLQCPEMMEDEVLIPKLGVYTYNTEDVNFKNTKFEGDYETVEM